MRIYNVFTNKTLNNSIFVEDKFSFLAFFLQILWLLYHKLWLPALTILLIEFIIFTSLEQGIINDNLATGIGLVVALAVAIHAKGWYMQSLFKQNYSFNGIITAINIDEAKLKFYTQTYKEE